MSATRRISTEIIIPQSETVWAKTHDGKPFRVGRVVHDAYRNSTDGHYYRTYYLVGRNGLTYSSFHVEQAQLDDLAATGCPLPGEHLDAIAAEIRSKCVEWAA